MAAIEPKCQLNVKNNETSWRRNHHRRRHRRAREANATANNKPQPQQIAVIQYWIIKDQPVEITDGKE